MHDIRGRGPCPQLRLQDRAGYPPVATDTGKHQCRNWSNVCYLIASPIPARLTISSLSVDYAKKKDKRAQIKFIKDETVSRDDVYKSHTVHVPSGEPPDSLSRPPAKRKPGVVRPITQGKLLRAGGPSVCCLPWNLVPYETCSCRKTETNTHFSA